MIWLMGSSASFATRSLLTELAYFWTYSPHPLERPHAQRVAPVCLSRSKVGGATRSRVVRPGASFRAS